jgi:hypothetical protein
MMTVASHRFDNAKRRRPENHPAQRQLTPSYLLELVRELLGGIELDPCTEPDNPTGADRFYCPPQDPPYGLARDRWVVRCIAEARQGARIALLIAAHVETRISQRAFEASTSVLFVKARLRFEALRANRRKEAASHGSALFGFNVDLAPLGALGVVMRRI